MAPMTEAIKCGVSSSVKAPKCLDKDLHVSSLEARGRFELPAYALLAVNDSSSPLSVTAAAIAVDLQPLAYAPVAYTHLTLPTI